MDSKAHAFSLPIDQLRHCLLVAVLLFGLLFESSHGAATTDGTSVFQKTYSGAANSVMNDTFTLMAPVGTLLLYAEIQSGKAVLGFSSGATAPSGSVPPGSFPRSGIFVFNNVAAGQYAVSVTGGPQGYSNLVVGFYALQPDNAVTYQDTATGEVILNVLPVKQGDSAWGQQSYDHLAGKTMAKKGCAVTSLAMALDFTSSVAGLPNITFNPGQLNTFLKNSPLGYTGAGSVSWADGVDLASGYNFQFHQNWILSKSNSTAFYNYLKTSLGTNHEPVIVKVYPNGPDSTHFVLVTGIIKTPTGLKYMIQDPAPPSAKYGKTFLDEYPAGYETRGSVGLPSAEPNLAPRQASPNAVPPPASQRVEISAEDVVQLQVIDAQGRISGANFSTGTEQALIPSSTTFTDGYDDVVTGEAPTERTHFVYLIDPQGPFTIRVRGVKPGSYHIAIWQTSPDGRRRATRLTGTSVVGGIVSYPYVFDYLPTPSDFSQDSKPDLLLVKPANGQTTAWYLNGAAYSGGAGGPSIPAGWSLAGTGDFNGDGKSDYVLVKPSNGQTYIWHLNGAAYLSSASGPTLPPAWTLAAVSDFNLDGQPDYLLLKPATGETMIWYMHGAAYAGGANGPTAPPGWTIGGAGDFNRDGAPDCLLIKPANGQTSIWYMNGPAYVSAAPGPGIPAGWTCAGAGDFNGDGELDYLLFKPGTGQTFVWLMKGAKYVSALSGPSLPPGWSLAPR